VLAWFLSQKFVMFMARMNNEDLTITHKLMKAERVTPVIDKRYSLAEVREAIRDLEEGQARGKIVRSLESEDRS
jgi:NADPH:quinone reductase-like Zn-dependent oxidoreductase